MRRELVSEEVDPLEALEATLKLSVVVFLVGEAGTTVTSSLLQQPPQFEQMLSSSCEGREGTGDDRQGMGDMMLPAEAAARPGDMAPCTIYFMASYCS